MQHGVRVALFSGWPMSTCGTYQTNWTGTWHGVMEAYPEGQLGAGWNATWEIGSYPMVANSCTTWRIVYTENGVVKQNKDNRFCRGSDPDDLFISESGGGKVAVQWINDMAVSPMKSGGVFAVVTLRMHGDTLEEQVLVTDDNPAVPNVIVSMRAHSFHTLRLKRKSALNNA